MKRKYKNCVIKVNRDKGLDGIERIYVSAVDENTGYIVMEDFYFDNLTMYEVLEDAKLVVDNYRGNEKKYDCTSE